MHISILTLFPEMFLGPFDHSIIKRAQRNKHIVIDFIQIRNFATDRYKTVDDHPYGGGMGMVLRVDTIDQAIAAAKEKSKKGDLTRTILLDPQGIPYHQKKAEELRKIDHLILICGHYEGIDQRIRELVDEEISIGDYVLTGGEIPAMVLVDSVVRLLPGVLSTADSWANESFSKKSRGRLEYPQYTRPAVYKRKRVPTVLLSGNHAAIEAWRDTQSLKKTKKRRPDLLNNPKISRSK